MLVSAIVHVWTPRERVLRIAALIHLTLRWHARQRHVRAVEDSNTDAASASAGPSATTRAATPINAAAPAASSAAAAAAIGGSAATAPGVSTSSTPVAGAAGPTPSTAQARANDDDAGTPQTPTQAPGSTAKQDKCHSDLALCLLDSPLNYDGCLRMAANNGCPMPDAGAPPSTVLDDNGNPISQVCQAELAKCIMKLPTPENALACTEKAKACK